MNKNIIIAIVAVAVLIAGFFYLQNKNGGESMESPSTVSDTTTGGTPQARGKSLRDLLGLGTSQKCTFTNTVDGTESTGTVYVSGGKVRGDFSSRVDANGKLVMSHMITDGTEMRMWQDGETMGIVMTLPREGDRTTSNSPMGDAPVNYDDEVDYDCAPWSADASVFTPPANIMFHSMSDMMQMGAPAGGGDAGMMEGMEPMNMDMGAAGGGVEYKEIQCRTCDQVSDAASKAQCKAAFECE